MIRPHHICKISLLVLVGSLAVPKNAQAQMVDYGSLQALFGEPITTSVTGTPQRVKDVPANMTIITADEIRQSGSRSIPEILARVPGLDVLQTGENPLMSACAVISSLSSLACWYWWMVAKSFWMTIPALSGATFPST